jgi:hypothetical protein
MNTYADKTEKKKNQSFSNGDSQLKRGGESTYQFVDNRPEAVAQRKLQEMGNNSPQVSQLRAVQEMANNSPQVKRMAQLQAIANNHSAQQHQTIQKKENNTGLPDALKSGMENLSGISLDDVKVHRNSDKPAQLQAHAYAQGTDIHLASGQEKHLPHEAWHVVQQKQGRVKPTMQMKGMVNVNDDAGLEKEADAMGAKAENIKFNTSEQLPLSLKKNTNNPVRQNKLKIGGNDITSFREKLLDFQKKGKLKKHECYEFGEVLSYWIDQEQDYEFVSWDESIIKAKDEKLPEKKIPTLEDYWAALSISEAEVNPEAAEEVRPIEEVTPAGPVGLVEPVEKYTLAVTNETKLVLKIPSGFPSLDVNVEIVLEEESDRKSTEWKYEAKGGVSYDVGIAKLGVEIELTLKVKVPKQGDGTVTPWDAAKMAVADFIMRQRRKDADQLEGIRENALPAINGAQTEALFLVGKAQTDLKDLSDEEVDKSLKPRSKWRFWEQKTLMARFLEHEVIVTETFKEALKLLGCTTVPELKSFSAETITSLVRDIVRTKNTDGVKVMELWAEWSKGLNKEAEGLRTLFHALNVAGIPKSTVQYSVQGMINAFAQLGDLDSTGLKMLVGAGVKASWNPDEGEEKFESIFMTKGELSFEGVHGKLTGEYNNSTKCWKGSLEAKIPNLLLPPKLFLSKQIQEKLLPACENEAQIVEVQGEKAEGLTKKSKDFMALAKEITTKVIQSEQSGTILSDLYVFFSIEQVKNQGKLTYKVDLEVGEGTTIKAEVFGQSAERTTKTKLKK